MHLSGAFQRSCKWTDCTLSNWHVVCAVQVKESQCVFGAMVHIGIAANARYRQQVDLGPNHGTRNRESVIEPRVAIDDE
jgi:hypothetical protein